MREVGAAPRGTEMNGWPRQQPLDRAAGSAPRARSRAPRRSARAAPRTAALASRLGASRLTSGSSSVALRRSVSTASATPGYCTLTTTSSPSSVVAAVDLADRRGRERAARRTRRRRRSAGRRAPRASASRAWRTGPAGRRRAASASLRLQLVRCSSGSAVELDHREQLPDLHRRAAHPAELLDELVDERGGALVARRPRPARASGRGWRCASPPSAGPGRSPARRPAPSARSGPVGSLPASSGGCSVSVPIR